ncbi:hypothetical protein [Rodentibacter caecimuris]
MLLLRNTLQLYYCSPDTMVDVESGGRKITSTALNMHEKQILCQDCRLA